ncbi:MAG: cupin domain-containing protein [Chloroflexota bacterium]
MEFISLKQKIAEADKDNLRNVHLFGADNFRSWMLHFEPGDGTPMHYHQSPETFLVVEGRCSVKGLKGDERILEKNDIVFLSAKEYYQLTNVGSTKLILFGNRAEPSGVRLVRAAE